MQIHITTYKIEREKEEKKHVLSCYTRVCVCVCVLPSSDCLTLAFQALPWPFRHLKRAHKFYESRSASNCSPTQLVLSVASYDEPDQLSCLQLLDQPWKLRNGSSPAIRMFMCTWA